MKHKDKHLAYRSFLEKIETFSEHQQEKYASQIHCQKGCDGCCTPPDSLFLIEADALKKGVQTLPLEERTQIHMHTIDYKEGKREACPLLFEGSCRVYAHRPTICRTHGYALWLRDTNELSWCPLNFNETTPRKEFAFDLEKLNTLLALVNQLSYPDISNNRCSFTTTIQEAICDD